MSPALTPVGTSRRPAHRPMIRIAAARALQLLGWPGVVGVALLAGSAVWLATAWETQGAMQQRNQRAVVVAPNATVATQDAEPAPEPLGLALRSDVPVLLAQVAIAARNNDLGWPAADYRINPATADRPASLEVRCTLKGPYPKLRRMLTQVLTKVPAATIREFSLARPNSDTLDVEAKLAIVVFIDDESASIVDAVAAGKGR